MFQEAVLAFLGVKRARSTKADQRVGEYCKGRAVEQCREMFGEAGLEYVCARCPD